MLSAGLGGVLYRAEAPDGGRYLHFAFDDNRHRAVYYGARLPV